VVHFDTSFWVDLMNLPEEDGLSLVKVVNGHHVTCVASLPLLKELLFRGTASSSDELLATRLAPAFADAPLRLGSFDFTLLAAPNEIRSALARQLKEADELSSMADSVAAIAAQLARPTQSSGSRRAFGDNASRRWLGRLDHGGATCAPSGGEGGHSRRH